MKEIKIPKITNLKIKEDLYYRSVQVNTFLTKNRWGALGEWIQLQTFKKLLHKDYVVADIGAALGLYTKVASDEGCKVFAFEPIKKNCDNIKLNIKDNADIEIINKAVYKETKKLNFKFDILKTEQGTISNNGMEIEAVCLDDILEKIEVIKIDVEGAEKEVLLGAKNILQYVKYIFIELHTQMKDITVECLNLILYLQRHNFNILYIDNSKDKYEHLTEIDKYNQPRILAYKNLTDVENKRLWEIINEKD